MLVLFYVPDLEKFVHAASDEAAADMWVHVERRSGAVVGCECVEWIYGGCWVGREGTGVKCEDKTILERDLRVSICVVRVELGRT